LVLTTLTVVTGLLSLLGTLVSLPYTPARFWAWRLRKHMENVKALDAERQPNQHEVLMRRADYIANKVAAAYHIPANKQMFRLAIIHIGFFLYVVVALVLQSIYLPEQSYLKRPVGVLMIVGYVVLQVLIWAIQIAQLKAISAHRAQFIARGCPPDFPTAPSGSRGPLDPSALTGAIAGYLDRRAAQKVQISAARKQRLGSVREQSLLKFIWVWLAHHYLWYMGVQLALFVGTCVLMASAMLGARVPEPFGSILLITTAVVIVAGIVPLAAFLSEVRRGREIVT
jgi:hypothetical protein